MKLRSVFFYILIIGLSAEVFAFADDGVFYTQGRGNNLACESKANKCFIPDLFAFIAEGNLGKAMDIYFSPDVSVNYQCVATGDTGFLRAIKQQQWPIARFLDEQKANGHIKNRSGETPALMLKSFKDYFQKKFIEKGKEILKRENFDNVREDLDDLDKLLNFSEDFLDYDNIYIFKKCFTGKENLKPLFDFIYDFAAIKLFLNEKKQLSQQGHKRVAWHIRRWHANIRNYDRYFKGEDINWSNLISKMDEMCEDLYKTYIDEKFSTEIQYWHRVSQNTEYFFDEMVCDDLFFRHYDGEKERINVGDGHGTIGQYLAPLIESNVIELTGNLEKYSHEFGMDVYYPEFEVNKDFNKNFRFYFLGDYVGRGLYSDETVVFLYKLKEKLIEAGYRDYLKLIIGNHDADIILYPFENNIFPEYNGRNRKLINDIFTKMYDSGDLMLCDETEGIVSCHSFISIEFLKEFQSFLLQNIDDDFRAHLEEGADVKYQEIERAIASFFTEEKDIDSWFESRIYKKNVAILADTINSAFSFCLQNRIAYAELISILSSFYWSREQDQDGNKTPCKKIKQRIGHTYTDNDLYRLIENNPNILCLDNGAFLKGPCFFYENKDVFSINKEIPINSKQLDLLFPVKELFPIACLANPLIRKYSKDKNNKLKEVIGFKTIGEIKKSVKLVDRDKFYENIPNNVIVDSSQDATYYISCKKYSDGQIFIFVHKDLLEILENLRETWGDDYVLEWLEHQLSIEIAGIRDVTSTLPLVKDGKLNQERLTAEVNGVISMLNFVESENFRELFDVQKSVVNNIIILNEDDSLGDINRYMLDMYRILDFKLEIEGLKQIELNEANLDELLEKDFDLDKIDENSDFDEIIVAYQKAAFSS